MNENVVQNEVVNEVESTETVTEAEVERSPAVSTEKFLAFIESGRTATMTQEECAKELGFTKFSSWSQRLNSYRKTLKETIAKLESGTLTYNGEPVKVDVESLKAKFPKFKASARGRQAGQKSELTGVQKAILGLMK